MNCLHEKVTKKRGSDTVWIPGQKKLDTNNRNTLKKQVYCSNEEVLLKR